MKTEKSRSASFSSGSKQTATKLKTLQAGSIICRNKKSDEAGGDGDNGEDDGGDSSGGDEGEEWTAHLFVKYIIINVFI